MDEHLDEPSIASRRAVFSLRSMLLWTAVAAVPLACLRQYYRMATNVIGQQIPIRDVAPAALAFLALGVLTLICIIGYQLYRRYFRLAIVTFLSTALCVVVGFPLIDIYILQPPQSQAEIAKAHLHSDAVALVAVAVKNHYQRTEAWPSSWDSLDEDIKLAAKTLSTPATIPLSAGPPSPTPTNLACSLSLEELSKIVDVNFSASSQSLAQEKWYKFSAIKPHPPSFNTYSKQMQDLIDEIAKSTSARK